MMNTRGNTFSREHVMYNDGQAAFWSFSVVSANTLLGRTGGLSCTPGICRAAYWGF